jgi:hypothetical protein
MAINSDEVYPPMPGPAVSPWYGQMFALITAFLAKLLINKESPFNIMGVIRTCPRIKSIYNAARVSVQGGKNVIESIVYSSRAPYPTFWADKFIISQPLSAGSKFEVSHL